MSNDAGIFQFGSSATVHDDLRRTLASEADAINKSNVNINEAIGVETKVRNQVLKDRSHAHNEMVRLRRTSSEFVQRLGMSEQIRQGISKTLETEVTAMMTTHQENEMMDRNDANGGNNNNNNDESQKKNAPTSNQHPTSLQSMKGSFQAAWDENTQLVNAMEEGRELMQEARAHHATVQANKSKIISEFDTLEFDLAKAQTVTTSYQQSLESEAQRHASLEATSSALDAEKEQLAKEMEEIQKAMDAENEAFAAEEQEMADELAERLEEERRQTQALAEVEAEIARIFNQTDTLHKDHAQFMEVSKALESKKAEYEQERVSRNQVFSTKNELESKIAQVDKKVTHAKRSVIQLEDDWTKIAKKKAINDAIDAEKIVPGRAELEALLQEKEKLESLVKDLESSDPNKEFPDIEKDKERLDDLKVQISEAAKLAEEKAESLKELSASRKTAQEAHDKKHADLVKALQDEEAALETASKEERHELAKLCRKRDVLQYGATLIEDSAKAEGSSPLNIMLDEVEDNDNID